jgi:hypothetical protein
MVLPMLWPREGTLAVDEPIAELDPRFSSPAAAPTEWVAARDRLVDAEVYWLSTVRLDGRPHVTPLLVVWLDGSLHFCTGPTEQKAKNLADNPNCVLTTGDNMLGEGLDLVVEGEAARVTDADRLARLADEYEEKYGEDWRFEVRDGSFWSSAGGTALVFEVVPSTVFGFAKGEVFSQTRFRF